MIHTFEKDPEEVLDYGFDLTRWLTGSELVVSGEVTITPSTGIGLGPWTTDGKQVYAMVSGGTLKQKYTLRLEAITDSVPPRVFARSITIFIIVR